MLDKFDADLTEKWRPMDEAARDGSQYLIGWFELPGQANMAVAFWHSTHNAWCNDHSLFSTHAAVQPTHYMRLPAPPVK